MRFRPFSEYSGINPRGYSQRLQRIICDFGADHSFDQVDEKLQEHYALQLPVSSIRCITEHHAQTIMELEKELSLATLSASSVVIGECDGTMVPIVETCIPEEKKEYDTVTQSELTQGKKDRRKHKRLFWKEARLSLARAHGSVSPVFAGTIGSVTEAGSQLFSCVQQAGATEATKVHCVGDGAAWIAHQVEEQFGANGSYLIDFYHLCEYLSAAATVCSKSDSSSWFNLQKERLKSNEHQAVLQALEPYRESDETEDSNAPIRACYRYIKNRTQYLDYRGAIEQGLPIGSGEIESAHRYIIQKRLKIPGAWWTLSNAKAMIHMRTLRKNKLWDEYWKKIA